MGELHLHDESNRVNSKAATRPKSLPGNWGRFIARQRTAKKPEQLPISSVFDIKGFSVQIGEYKNPKTTPQTDKGGNIIDDIAAEKAIEKALLHYVENENKQRQTLRSLPIRPILTSRSRVAGRYFPKANLDEEQKGRLKSERMRTRTAASCTPRLVCREWERSNKSRGSSYTSFTGLPEFPQRSTKSRSRKSTTSSRCTSGKGTTRDEPVYALKIKNESEIGGAYDPSSELHSDYYSVQRVRMQRGDSKLSLKKMNVEKPNTAGMDCSIGNGRTCAVMNGVPKPIHERYAIPVCWASQP